MPKSQFRETFGLLLGLKPNHLGDTPPAAARGGLIPAALKQLEPRCGKVPQARREPGRQAMAEARGINFKALKLTPAGFVSTKN